MSTALKLGVLRQFSNEAILSKPAMMLQKRILLDCRVF